MHVSIDPDRCQGHARCWELCPEVFGLDEAGNGVVLTPEVAAESQDSARNAALNCPERAITVR
jgi:ferredoxin